MGVVTSALVKTFVTKVINLLCSGRRVAAVFPLKEGGAGLRPMAKSTVSTTQSTTYSETGQMRLDFLYCFVEGRLPITSLEISSSSRSTRAWECVAGST